MGFARGRAMDIALPEKLNALLSGEQSPLEGIEKKLKVF